MTARPQDVAPHNPWREFIENCKTGDNYFRSSEYDDLLSDLDDGYAAKAALASAQAREDELRAACDKWSERELLFGAHEDLQARAERAEASAERWRSRYIAEVVCYRMDQHGDTASEALDAANAVAEKLAHLDKARAALSTNAATQTGERNG